MGRAPAAQVPTTGTLPGLTDTSYPSTALDRTAPGATRTGPGPSDAARRWLVAQLRLSAERNCPMTPHSRRTGRPISLRIRNEAFYRAVVAAGQAPSACHTQPWRWQVKDGALDLLMGLE